MIKLENVTKVYKTGVRAVNDMNLTIAPGEFVYVIGPTGAGKSTFIKLLYREEKATSGKVIVAGQDVSKIINRKVPYFRRNIGVVFQNYRLLPKKTVFENVAFALMVQNYAEDHPDTCMETPQVTAAVYPQAGADRVVELSFTYQTNRDALRNMQAYVEPVFEAAVLNVKGEETQEAKFALMYAFLMERSDYQLETSITPAYSLLRHGVGDCKAFATVYAAMCRRAGLDCQVVTGTKEGNPWVWNIICENGIYYHVDLLNPSNGGRLQKLAQEFMQSYVWDYSSYPASGSEQVQEQQEITSES